MRWRSRSGFVKNRRAPDFGALSTAEQSLAGAPHATTTTTVDRGNVKEDHDGYEDEEDRAM